MRPMSRRARRRIAASGALCLAAAGAAVPAMAQSNPVGASATPKHAVRIARARVDVLAGRSAYVTGTVRQGAAGLRVVLERRSGDGWTALDDAVTRHGGGFRLSFTPRRPDSAPIRVRVAAA